MIVWLASYPRSGNTFLRIVVNRLFGVPTYVVYDVDGVAQRVGGDLIGFQERPAELRQMAEAGEVHLVKTHRQREDDHPAICLVRDGRDSVVSWARLNTPRQPGESPEEVDARFRASVREHILRPGTTGTGNWGRNVLSWLDPPAPQRILLRYEDLVRDPATYALTAMARVAPDLRPIEGAAIPSFAELRRVDDGFFRRGMTGSHRDELPDDLHELFWAQPENVAAMDRLGYSR
ncbi:sulfotransferase domain-containing protein [Actinopolymorpha alba]|uniref:sulfotransferase domain-containing protein n=1 Tax=Actinopolymorpha alba TaxID=533267 RepID=UPI00036FBC5B|nr:sulfotransferase domain-containing protein [Actinopolymorpha alba]